MNSNNSQQYEELYNHFFHIAEMIRGTVSIDTGSMLPILQVIVLKRFLDDYSVHGSKDYSQYWLTLRNLSAHNRLPQMMSELNRIYDEISDQNPLFRDVCFESYENRNIAETLPVIVLYLHNVDFSEFKKKDIGKAFNDFITKMFGGKYLGESVSSNFIRKLITSVIEIKPGDKIYDPAVGIGGFFVEASNYCTEEGIVSFEGQEKNFETYSICRLNLYMNGIDYRGIHCSDSLLHPINVPARFDRVVSDFPFNMKINKEEFNQILETDCFNRFDKELSSNSRGDYLFIQHIISSLDQKGKGAFLVPEGVLFRLGKEKLLRKEIVDSDVIHSLVFLPSGVLSNSMIPVVIMVIDKNKPLKLKRSIFMIDLTDEIKFERRSIQFKQR